MGHYLLFCCCTSNENSRPGINTVIIGPGNDRPGAVKLGNNQSFTQEEGQAFEDITKAGYTVQFALLKEKAIGEWPKFREKFDVK